MAAAEAFLEYAANRGITFYTGVPDSLLKNFFNALADSRLTNVMAPNEGAALSIAAGSYIATGNPAMVYLQNSGLGNLVNPALSLVDPSVYGIPALLLIGWRGRPSMKDEPQHMRQGALTLPLLDTLGIPAKVVTPSRELEVLGEAYDEALERRGPVALVVPADYFDPFPGRDFNELSPLTREAALTMVLDAGEDSDLYVSTTGMLSRELFELRENRNEGHSRDFLTVGSMGHAISIALGVALSRPERRILCLDGDGSLLMHMGSAATAAQSDAANLYHIVFNNGVHDSVGAQPTIARALDLPMLGRSLGYNFSDSCDDGTDLSAVLPEFLRTPGPAFLEVVVRPGSRPNLGRPTTTPQENMSRLMAEIGSRHVDEA